jgi:hypothetical protein
MSPAKTNAERQADLKARRTAAGLVSLKNVWVHPDDVPEMREHAAKLARRRERAAKRAAP